MKQIYTNNDMMPINYTLPKWKFLSKWWLSLIPFILSLIVFFIPWLSNDRFNNYRYLIGFILLFSPIMFSTSIWLIKTLITLTKRIKFYPSLFKYLEKRVDELNNAKKTIFEIVKDDLNNNAFELKGARFYKDKLFIIVKKDNKPKLNKNDILLVAHIGDSMPMGLFQITEDRSDEYYAIELSDIDPVWASFVRQKGEIHFMPYMLAIHIPKGEI